MDFWRKLSNAFYVAAVITLLLAVVAIAAFDVPDWILVIPCGIFVLQAVSAIIYIKKPKNGTR